MTCDVQQYLPPDDSPDPAVESLVHQIMWAISAPRRRGRSFLPPGNLELIVKNEDGQQLTLLAYRYKGREFISEVHRHDAKLRALHSHDGHRNPGRNETPIENGHIHFPSRLHPLLKSHTSYAYSVNCPRFVDTVHCLEFFCAELNIGLEALQMPLPDRGAG